jgi:hypothetical protein
MSKTISFGLGKQKPSAPGKAPDTRGKPPTRKPDNGRGLLPGNDSDNEDEAEPQHESVTGFSSSGAVLSTPMKEKEVKVIQNTGNGDWRNRGRTNLLPQEVQAARNGPVVVVEKDEVSTASGLQYAAPTADTDSPAATVLNTQPSSSAPDQPAKPMNEDEVALAALLGDRPMSNTVIAQKGNARLSGQDETADFRDDVASRPDSCTLEDYAAMPVEEFGLAMLRGMGQKRKAAGQTVEVEGSKDDNPRKMRKQEGFLGIGAKAAPGSDIELGAWGKADMRKNNKGQGFFTPLMRENKATGERITEEEFQKRTQEARKPKGGDDWRERRDRNLERNGRDHDRPREREKPKAITNGEDYKSSRHSSSSRRDREDRNDDGHRSRSSKNAYDYESSSSKRYRSRSREKRKRDDDKADSKHRHRDRERYRDEDRYESSSSHRSRHSERSRERDRDRRKRDR